MKILLEVNNLAVKFSFDGKSITAVEDATFKINNDETMVLAGESGSGKTITALSITRILPPQAKIIGGSIIFSGEDLLKIKENDLVKIRGKEISYIFQEPSSYLNPVLTIARQVAEVVMLHQGKNKREAEEEAERLLEIVKIPQPSKRLLSYPHSLSGGMNQRVMIAMALAARPKLLIADEPTTALDVTTELEILQLLEDLKNQLKFSILFITHNLSLASRIADRITIMYKGRVVEENLKANIFRSPQHLHTKALISAYEKIGKL